MQYCPLTVILSEILQLEKN